LASLSAGFDHELEDPTFVRFLTRSGGQSGWILRTLDFGTAGYDPIQFADWQCLVSVLELKGQRASDHKPVEIRFQLRKRPKRRKTNARNQPIPAWLFRDDGFRDDWISTVLAWASSRAEGFSALGEFVDLTRACASEWLQERIVEVKTSQHKFQTAMSMQMSARLCTPMSFKTSSRRLAAYPHLRSMCSLEVDVSCSSVHVQSTDDLVNHIHELANKAVDEREREDAGQQCGVSSGETLQGSVLYPAAATDLKRMLPTVRHHIVEMWSSVTHRFETDPHKIGNIIRSAGLERSGSPRGDVHKRAAIF
jgi:hypothetical protein